jgi:hypothetical protein
MEKFTIEIKLPVKSEKRFYREVIADHEDENGNIHIDAYETSKPNEQGKTLCVVSPDGKILFSDDNIFFKMRLEDVRVREEIEAALIRQEERKQELVDKVLEEQKEMLEIPEGVGDFTVLDELLKFIPCKYLMNALDEDKWSEYPSGWAEQEVAK